jgi:hypothetical protein
MGIVLIEILCIKASTMNIGVRMPPPLSPSHVRNFYFPTHSRSHVFYRLVRKGYALPPFYPTKIPPFSKGETGWGILTGLDLDAARAVGGNR